MATPTPDKAPAITAHSMGSATANFTSMTANARE